MRTATTSRLNAVARRLGAWAVRLRPPVVPSARCVAGLVGLAVVALVVATVQPQNWAVVPLAGLALMALTLADGMVAGRLIDAAVQPPAQAEVGADTPIRVTARLSGGAAVVQASLAMDPRLCADPAQGGRVDLTLTRETGGHYQGRAVIAPARRCSGAITGLWLRWSGPLGLGLRQYHRPVDATLRVLPNVALLRSPALQAYLRDSDIGLIARRLRGDGTLFETLAEYQPGMDRRRIDWKVSARHAHLYAKEYENERNNQIVFALDCGQAMCEPVGGLPRLDRAVSAALATAWVALKGGDRSALFGFGGQVMLATPFASHVRDFAALRSDAATLDYESREPNFTLALATLATRLQRRSLIVVFSDFSDPTSAELMVEAVGRLIARHRVLFVTMRDEELDSFARATPQGMEQVAMAVAAQALLRQRAMVTGRLRQMGVDVIEAPYQAIGMRLLDAYLKIKRRGGIG
ncbi:DUF58 domain-containing protein [Novosphingobium sp. FSY-8]|uniref:DUF58 domain-containing protein n=1 Tax=Novosphingobium ovatum TaxID=1908523 RepID=A0ABW9XGL7_9SPHN|nr:DUF58 domain-containing protein [Novosphingobium ovatum]NBC37562.1 DUF58 domain-containing protein [Novosphingobium ovatum]